jgi:hypothetical protein
VLQRRYQLLERVEPVLDVAPALVLGVDVVHPPVLRWLCDNGNKTNPRTKR